MDLRFELWLRGRVRSGAFLLFQAAVLAISLSVFSLALANQEAELARRAAEVRQRLSELKGDEDAIVGSLEALDELVAIEMAASSRADESVRDASAALEYIRKDIESTRRMQEKRLEDIKPRLVAKYRLGSLGYLPILLSAQSVPDFLSHTKMLGRILDADMEAIREIRRLHLMLQQQIDSLEKAKGELEELRLGAHERLEALRQAQLERESALAVVRADRRLQQQSLARINEARRELERRMEVMSRIRSDEIGFESLKGRLPMPVSGDITKTFSGSDGDSRGQKIHRGVDISSPRGNPVRAVADGEVVHADWLRGYGNLVIMDHGGGYYSLMAHMEKTLVRRGDVLGQGDTVGLVGNSGTWERSHLYFEIRRGAQALDPQEWFGNSR